MKKETDVIFIYTYLSSFVKNDIEVISKHYTVNKHRYIQSKTIWGHTSSILKELYFLLTHITKSKFIFIWFSDYHSLLPILFGKIFNKKVFLVLGGYDVAHLPDFDYSVLKNPIRAFCAKYSLNNATAALAVSNYVKNEALKICTGANVNVIYNGIKLVDNIDPNIERQDIILTVAQVETKQRFRLKGIDFFIKLANELPQYRFVLIGIKDQPTSLINPLHSNVETYEFMEYEELINFYQTAKVYCQFSVVESFGLAMLEAMYFGCKPVANDVGALAEIVGEYGIIITPFNLAEAKRATTNYIENFEYNKNTSEAVSKKFSLQERENKLTELFKTYNLFEKK